MDYLGLAQRLDKLRVVARIIFFGYGFWIIHITHWLVSWYMKLPPEERTPQQAAFVGGTITVLTGLFPWIYRIYSDNSNDWTAPSGTKTQMATVTTETTK
jgi:hypothetical protein